MTYTTSLKIDACTPPQFCLHTPFPTPTHPHTQEIVGFLACPTPLHFALCLLLLQLQTVLACPNSVYAMHFTNCSLQWHLRKLRSSKYQCMLYDSTYIEQWPRIQAHFKYYPNIYLCIYTKNATKYQLSIPLS